MNAGITAIKSGYAFGAFLILENEEYRNKAQVELVTLLLAGIEIETAFIKTVLTLPECPYQVKLIRDYIEQMEFSDQTFNRSLFRNKVKLIRGQ